MNFPQCLAGVLLALAASQARSEGLKPCDTVLSEYYQEIDSQIDDAIARRAEVSIDILQSFFAESGVRLVDDAVYFVQFKESIWGRDPAERQPAQRPDLTVSHTALSNDLANKVKSMFVNAIASAQRSDRIGVDGTTYRVVANSSCGEAWSPEPGSAAADVAELVRLLKAHAQLSRPRAVQESEQAIAHFLGNQTSR